MFFLVEPLKSNRDQKYLRPQFLVATVVFLFTYLVSYNEFKQKVITQGKDYPSMKGPTL